MPEAIAVTIAKEVTARLTDAGLSQEFTPERSYLDWALKLNAMHELHVDVVCGALEQRTDLSTRSNQFFSVPVDIVVRKRFSEEHENDDTLRIDIEEIDALVLLVEEIHLCFTKERLEDFDSAAWEETRILSCPDAKSLRELRQFTGAIRVTFVAHLRV